MTARNITLWLANLFFVAFVAQGIWIEHKSGTGIMASAFNFVSAAVYLWALNNRACNERWRRFLSLGPLLWIGAQALVFSRILGADSAVGPTSPGVWVFVLSESFIFLSGVCFVLYYWFLPAEPNRSPKPTRSAVH